MKLALYLIILFSNLHLFAEPAPANDEKHIIACTILSSKGEVVFGYAGRYCVFLDDGSYISSVIIDKLPHVVRFGPHNEIIWKRKIEAYHQINLSPDKKRVLVLSSERSKKFICNVRFDVLNILDIGTGKTLFYWNTKDYITDLIRIFRSFSTPFLHSIVDYNGWNCELTHLNSAYEIPDNENSKINSAFSPGNYILNFYGFGRVLIIDKNSKKIVWESSLGSKRLNPLNLHDVQVLDDGNILYARNFDFLPDVHKSSSFELFNPMTEKTTVLYPIDKKDYFSSNVMGGIQKLNDGYLLAGNSKTQGGWVIKIDSSGKNVLKYFYPIKINSELSYRIQDVKSYDVNLFFTKKLFVSFI
jgi:hypothetical protein